MTTVLQTSSSPPVRLLMAPLGAGPRRIDGVWWPRTGDLLTELPLLLGALPYSWARVASVTVSGSMWSSMPGRMLVANQVVELHRARVVRDPHTICLLAPGMGRWDLAVVPPQTTEAEAQRLMADAVAMEATAVAAVMEVAEAVAAAPDGEVMKASGPRDDRQVHGTTNG
ncbi:DUF5994 family protein [Streptomyces sp. NPDC002701]|uniref:DUF5994 family protein n=1 Tax=Streptomyces sp. NPDC002701 TaxID=3364661 RepID=UPI0036A0D830